MKRIRLFLIILVFICPLLFANDGTALDLVSQMLMGFIDINTELFVENDLEIYDPTDANDKGFNLDVDDNSNPYKYLIAPTEIGVHELGLRIGKFSFIASTGTQGTITITHDKLWTEDPDNQGQYVYVDYELGISYTIKTISNNNTTEQSVSQFGLSSDSININISSSWISSVYIKDGGIHFRLVKSDPVVKQGVYSSTITFIFTADPANP